MSAAMSLFCIMYQAVSSKLRATATVLCRCLDSCKPKMASHASDVRRCVRPVCDFHNIPARFGSGRIEKYFAYFRPRGGLREKMSAVYRTVASRSTHQHERTIIINACDAVEVLNYHSSPMSSLLTYANLPPSFLSSPLPLLTRTPALAQCGA